MRPLETPEPLVLRASRRRPIVGTVVVVSAWCLVFVLLAITESGRWLFAFLPMAISTGVLFYPVMFPASARGDTVVDMRGVTRRRGRSHVHVPWEEVARVCFTAGPIWCGYRLTLVRRSGRSVPLAAPSAGVFTPKRELAARLEPLYARAGSHRARVAARPITPAARLAMMFANALGMGMLGLITFFALYITSPWTQAWWPGREEAARLPNACSVVDQALITRLVPKPAAQGGQEFDGSGHRSCVWGTQDPPAELSVRLELVERFSGSGGGASERAHDFFRYRADRDRASAIKGVGDEAGMRTERRPDGSVRSEILARKGNVLVTVLYGSTGAPGQVSTEAIRTARAVIDGIRFE